MAGTPVLRASLALFVSANNAPISAFNIRDSRKKQRGARDRRARACRRARRGAVSGGSISPRRAAPAVRQRPVRTLPDPALDPLFRRLSGSRFRARFRLGAREAAYLARCGAAAIEGHAAEFVAARLAPAAPKNDGRQTPMRGHPVFVAQHATATCCRGCLARWHRLPAGRELDAAEQARIVAVIMEWIARQPQP
ncbi:DUF4186 domain-containing protein [Roseivivax sp. CAU 1761]